MVKNSNRHYPYDIIMDYVIENDFGCLEKVFDKERRINSTKILIQEIDRNCNMDMEGVLKNE